MTPHDAPEAEIVTRCFTDNGCEVTAIVTDSTGEPQTLYGTVTRHGVLVGSYYCVDHARQSDWRIVTALGLPLDHDGRIVRLESEKAAVHVLTTVLTARDSFEAEQQFLKFIRTPQ